MSPTALFSIVPVYALVFFRIAGMMTFAPLFGSGRIPRRVKVLITAVLAFTMTGVVAPPAVMPATMWDLTLGIAGEMMFGLAMGLAMSFTFIAVQWAGEIIGQQMGFNLAAVFDPQFGNQGSLVGDLMYMLALVIFLCLPAELGGPGHHALLRGVSESFDALPLLSLGVNMPLLQLLFGLLQSTTTLALQLAAPILVTMLVVDLSLGLIGKTMPQFNIMTTGTTLRSVVGMVVLILGIALTGTVVRDSLVQAMNVMRLTYVHGT
jgi:flagellar biosynthetic protein FliR